jgi:hypothetical protein
VLWPVLLLVLLVAIAFGACRIGGSEQAAGPASAQPAASPAAGIASPAAMKPATAASPAAAKPSPGAASGATKPTAPPAAKPTTAAAAKPTSAVAQAAKPASPADVDRDRIVRDATWTPGQLASHFEKHGREGPWASESVYDASARETVAQGTAFTYQDRESNAERLGFFEKASNRFTAVTRDGRRITTHFRPDRGEAYVRGLTRSTYR